MTRMKQFLFRKENYAIRVITICLAVCLLAGVFSVTASATTYRIIDGDQILIFTTDTTDPMAVLDEAGLELGKDDTYTTQESGLYSEIHVQRVQMITINFGGQIIKTGSYGETVEQLLARLNITYTENDKLSVELTDETYDGMEIVIDQIVYATETYAKTVPYEVEYVYDDTLPEGYETVKVAGSDGEMICTDIVTYENGVEVSRTQSSAEVTAEAVNQVVTVGTAEVTEGELYIANGVIVTADGEMYTYYKSEVYKATAYTHTDAGCNTTTATGTTVRWGTVAVDPSVIPYGTRMFIVSNDGKYVYGVAVAEDCGGAIKQKRVDLYMPTASQCYAFGVRNCTIYFLDK